MHKKLNLERIAALQAFIKKQTRNPHVLYVHSGFCVLCALHQNPNIKFVAASSISFGYGNE